MVWRALTAGRPLLAEAPTGTGKTLGVLYAALRRLPDSAAARVIYLTAQICEVLSPRVKAGLCAIALREPALLRRGFPDLLLLGGERDRYELIEVKGPGDVLRPEQRRWFAELAAAGLSARVLELRWA